MKLELLLAVLCLLYAGCSNKDAAKNSQIMPCYTITYGSGGGVTGLYDGYYIDSLGTVSSWSGRTFATSEKKTLGRLTEKEISEMTSAIKDNHLLDISHRQNGNITTYFIFRKTGGEQTTISWPGFAPDKKISEELNSFYKKFLSIINRVKQYQRSNG